MEKKNIALMIIVAGILFLVVILNVPLKAYVDKSLNCIDTNSQDTIVLIRERKHDGIRSE